MLDAIHTSLDAATKAAASPPCLLGETALRQAETAIHQLANIVAGLQIAVTREVVARGVAHDDGHPDAAKRLQNQHLFDPQPARERARTIDALQKRPAIERALLDGLIDERQARVIADAVNQIPDTLADFPGVPAGTVADKAEAFLLDKAATFPAQKLCQFADRILTHVAPHLAEQAEAAALARAEARAARKRGFSVSAPVNGMVHLSGRLGVEDANILNAALHPLCTPISGDTRTAEQKRADALVEICGFTLRAGELPEDGGEPPQLAVSVKYDTLTGQLGTGLLPDGERVTPETVRRLACDARLLPFVLGGKSQILDAGRSRRTATGPLRRALTIRDRGCAHPSCDRPTRWTEAHHLVPWQAGGATDLDNLVLLCRRHHRLLHTADGGWQVRMSKDHLPEFIPPPWVDPLQIPCRNEFHMRT